MADESNALADPRAVILKAAVSAFAEAGLAGARVDDIAGRAGVNKRMLYHHVGDKAALYEAAVAVCTDRLQADWAEAGAGVGWPPSADVVEAWQIVCQPAAARHPALDAFFADIVEAAQPQGSNALRLFAVRAFVALQPGVARRCLGGEDADDPDAVGAALTALVSPFRPRQNPEAGKPRLKMRPKIERPV